MPGEAAAPCELFPLGQGAERCGSAVGRTVIKVQCHFFLLFIYLIIYLKQTFPIAYGIKKKKVIIVFSPPLSGRMLSADSPPATLYASRRAFLCPWLPTARGGGLAALLSAPPRRPEPSQDTRPGCGLSVGQGLRPAPGGACPELVPRAQPSTRRCLPMTQGQAKDAKTSQGEGDGKGGAS